MLRRCICFMLFHQDGAPVSKRDRCIKELIDTEKNYINALQMIREVSSIS